LENLRANCLNSMQTLLECKHPDFNIPNELKSDKHAVLTASSLCDVVPI